MAKSANRGGNQGHKNYQKDYRQGTKDKQAASAQMAVATVRNQAHSDPAKRPTTEAPAAGGIGAQTLQQQRAKYALERVKAALADTTTNRKEFKSYSASFPAMIQMNGLGQAAAFYFSQGESYRRLYHILSDWLTQAPQPYAGQSDLLAGVTAMNMHTYRIAQAEALLVLDWVMRFAKAFVREERP